MVKIVKKQAENVKNRTDAEADPDAFYGLIRSTHAMDTLPDVNAPLCARTASIQAPNSSLSIHIDMYRAHQSNIGNITPNRIPT